MKFALKFNKVLSYFFKLKIYINNHDIFFNKALKTI